MARHPGSDLPPCSFRTSRRARRLRIRVSPAEGVVVVVPSGVSRSVAERFVTEKRDWIGRAVARLESRHGPLEERLQAPLPETIELPAVGLAFHVDYEHLPDRAVRASTSRVPRLHVSGDLSDTGAARAALRGVLADTARRELVPWLRDLGEAGGLFFRKARVAGQRTLWGSCSRRGTISLNYKLLFLPPSLVEYVLIHELAHTVHPNHSGAFWALVGAHVPEYCERHRELREAGAHVPGWAEIG